MRLKTSRWQWRLQAVLFSVVFAALLSEIAVLIFNIPTDWVRSAPINPARQDIVVADSEVMDSLSVVVAASFAASLGWGLLEAFERWTKKPMFFWSLAMSAGLAYELAKLWRWRIDGAPTSTWVTAAVITLMSAVAYVVLMRATGEEITNE